MGRKRLSSTTAGQASDSAQREGGCGAREDGVEEGADQTRGAEEGDTQDGDAVADEEVAQRLKKPDALTIETDDEGLCTETGERPASPPASIDSRRARVSIQSMVSEISQGTPDVDHRRGLERHPSRISERSRSGYRDRQMNLFVALEAFEQRKDELNNEEEKRHCVIHPDRPPRLIWDMIALLAITYQALTVPYELAFLTGTPLAEVCLYRTAMPDEEVSNKCLFSILSLIVDIFFLFDVMINFVTGFYDKGALVLSKHRCAWHYARTWLTIDVLGIFPWRYVSSADEDRGKTKILRLFKFLKFIRLLKLLRVMKLRQMLIKLEDHLKSQYLYVIFQLIKLSLCLLLLCHITACAWYGIGRHTIATEGDSGRHSSWIQEAGLPTSDCEGECYCAALYFTMATMTTVGYGDIHAGTSPVERGFATLLLLAGTGVFAMLVSSIASLFQNNQSSASIHATPVERNRAALRYLWRTGASGALTAQLRNYLGQKEQLKEDMLMEQHLRDNLSLSLLHDLCVESFRSWIVKFDFFRDLRSQLIEEICTICMTARFCPGEVVCVEGDDADAMFFIKHGRVSVFRRFLGFTGSVLTEGMYFGEACIFTDNLFRQATIICDTFCELVRLEKARLMELREWQDDLRVRIRHRVRRVSVHSQLLASNGKFAESQDHARLSAVCGICRVQGHYPNECPAKKMFDEPGKYLILGTSKPELVTLPERCRRLARAVLPVSLAAWIVPKPRVRRRMVIMGVCTDELVKELRLAMPCAHDLRAFQRSRNADEEESSVTSSSDTDGLDDVEEDLPGADGKGGDDSAFFPPRRDMSHLSFSGGSVSCTQ